MHSIFPLFYSAILFFSLVFICFYVLGQLRMTQKVERRISVLENKLKTNQKLSDNFYKLGQIYLQKNLYDKAINLFRQSLERWDLNDKIGLGSLYNTLGFTYFKLKQYEYAKYYYLQAIKLLPDYTLALTNLALIYEINKMYLEAYSTYSTVLSYDYKNKIALSRLLIIKKKANLIRDGRI
jgi:tetratricopeptide (TPR) repeat protein